jgi:hypothetical protein
MLNGNLYLAGFSNLAGEDGLFRPVLMRYSQSLSRDWKVRPTDHRGTFNAVASLGDAIFAVGSAEVGTDLHFLIEKYDESGGRVWSNESSGGGQTSLQGIVSVGGRLFAAGYTNTMGAGGLDVLLVEFDPATGAIVSSTTYGGAQDDQANAIAADGAHLYLTGSSRSFASVDGNSVGQSDLVLLRYSVGAANLAPTAAAGPNQTVRPGTLVHLDGSASNDDNTATAQLSFAWSFESTPLGSTATLTAANTVTPSFVPDAFGTYVVRLVVTDQAGAASAPAAVVIGQNTPPMAHAGLDALVIVGSTVTLAGSASDAENDPLVTMWSFTSTPGGSTAGFNDTHLLGASFVADVPGAYVASLVAADVLGEGAPDDVQITATTAATYAEVKVQAAADVVVNLPPGAVTNAGNQNTLVQFLSIAAMVIHSGHPAAAVQKLQATLTRLDGCANHGTPDTMNGPDRDWVTTCNAQGQIYPLLQDAIAALTP